jgi:hypothetical protein
LDIDKLTKEEQNIYMSGVGKLLYLACWSQLDIQNITRELSRYFMTSSQSNLKAMKRVMTFCVNTKGQGIIIEPKGKWDPHNNQPYTITRVSDSDYAKDAATRRSASVYFAFIKDSLISATSKMQEAVTLSVAEAELIALLSCIQEMLHLNNFVDIH